MLPASRRLTCFAYRLGLVQYESANSTVQCSGVKMIYPRKINIYFLFVYVIQDDLLCCMEIPDFKKQGRPRVYDFDKMEVGKVYHIPLKKGQKDAKLDSARSLCSAHSKDGKKFRATADETGVYILRET